MSAPSVPFMDLAAQYRQIRGAVDAAVSGVLTRCDFVLGAEVAAFEAEFADYCGTAHAVGVDSGLSALELGIRALGIGPGDEVITPVNSFIASSSAISLAGATPVWVDADPVSHTIDQAAVEAAVTPRTRAVMVVHLYGQPADMTATLRLAQRAGLAVIEDACQAHGARWAGRRVGGFGAFSAFSCYPGKNLGGYGDGGVLTTNDPVLAERVRRMRNYGQVAKYEHVDLPANRRLDTLQAAVLRVKLRHLDEWNTARRRHADTYAELLRGAGLILPAAAEQADHVWHLFVVRVPAGRDELARGLQRRGVATGLHYPVPIHLQPCYASAGVPAGAFPVAEAAARRVLSLPMFPELTPAQLELVAAGVHDVVGAEISV